MPNQPAQDALAAEPLDSAARRWARRRDLAIWILLPLVSFLWFWHWRSELFNGGDSEQYSREIAQGIWLRKRQMLAFGLLRLADLVMRLWLGWTAERAFNFVSCAAGSVTLLVVWRCFRGRAEAIWPFLIVATAGFTALFYGHIETYPFPVFSLALHLLAVQRSAEGKWPIWAMPVTHLLFLFFHLVSIFVLPALVLVYFLELRRRGSSRAGLAISAAAAATGFIFWALINYTDFGMGEMIGGATVHPMLELALKPWRIFDQPFYVDKLYFIGVNAGLAFPFIFVAFWLGRRDRVSNYWLAYFIWFLGFMAIWCPFMGERDWDLFCFPWVVGAFGLARSILLARRRAVWIGIILGGNVALWLCRPFVYSNQGRHEYGTIEFENRDGERLIRALIDDRVPMDPVNQFQIAGPHLVTIFEQRRRGEMAPGGDHRQHALRRVIRVEPGRAYRYILDSGKLDLIQ